MQYTVSDIHGCYDKYIELLRCLDLKQSDTLYILGDMIDCGPDGLKDLDGRFPAPQYRPVPGEP